MNKTVGEYFQEPAEQKYLLEATAASLGPHVDDLLLLLQVPLFLLFSCHSRVQALVSL
jgi:hypothetical protein